MNLRPDETWHRLREWTYGQAPSERLAAQILISAGYQDLDPIHPLGGVLADRIEPLSPRPPRREYNGSLADIIRLHKEQLPSGTSATELRKIESNAGLYYWKAWAAVPTRFKKNWRDAVPDHWNVSGPRVSRLDKKRARSALTPAHAMLNYLYAMLETEATIAAHKLGFDPSIGILHTDQRYRRSLASDLMEPVRPIADRVVLDLLAERELARGEVLETREGVCRLGPVLARELAAFAEPLRRSVAPHAEQLARTLLNDEEHPTPAD